MGEEKRALLVGGDGLRPRFLALETDAQIKEDGGQRPAVAYQVQAGSQLAYGLIELSVLRQGLRQRDARLPIVRMVLHFSLKALDANERIGMARYNVDFPDHFSIGATVLVKSPIRHVAASFHSRTLKLVDYAPLSGISCAALMVETTQTTGKSGRGRPAAWYPATCGRGHPDGEARRNGYTHIHAPGT